MHKQDEFEEINPAKIKLFCPWYNLPSENRIIRLTKCLNKQWADDKSSTNCKICNGPFSIWRRRHHCRVCGNAVCYECYKYKYIVNPLKRPITYDLAGNIHEALTNLKGGMEESITCNKCCSQLEHQDLGPRRIIQNIFSYLDLKEIKQFMHWNKLCYELGKQYCQTLFQIQYYPLDRGLTEDERLMILTNKKYLLGHSSYLFALLRADRDYKMESFNKTASCKNLNCHLGCREVLMVEDYVVILSTYNFQSLRTDKLVKICCDQIFKLITDDEAEPLVTLFMERTFLTNVCDLLIKLSERSEKLLYLIYWQSLHSSKILPDKIEQHYLRKGGPETNLLQMINETYNNFSLFNWNRIQNITETKSHHYAFINQDKLFISKTIVGGKLEVKTSKSRPVVLPLKDYKGQIKRFLLKKDNLKRDFIVNRVIKLMIFYIKRELNLDLDLTPVNYLVYLLKGEHGIIEIVEDSYTIHDIKNNYKRDLQSFIYGMNRQETVEVVLNRFLNSLAVYTIIIFLLGIGDRHLDNIMIHKSGLVFHIDFEYILGEKNQFVGQGVRITPDMLQILGGEPGDDFRKFRNRCIEIYNCLRKHNRILGCLISLVADSKLSKHDITKFINERFEPCARYLNVETYITNMLAESHDTIKNDILDSVHSLVKILK